MQSFEQQEEQEREEIEQKEEIEQQQIEKEQEQQIQKTEQRTEARIRRKEQQPTKFCYCCDKPITNCKYLMLVSYDIFGKAISVAYYHEKCYEQREELRILNRTPQKSNFAETISKIFGGRNAKRNSFIS